jgi:hypothetical protein
MAFDPESRLQLTVSNKSGGLGDNFVTKIATIPNGKHFFGTYGGGLYQSKVDLRLHSRRLRDREPTPVQIDEEDESYLPKFPIPPKPLTLEQLNAMDKQIDKLYGERITPYATYLGEDWKTQGDWSGRIYREWAIACAAVSPHDTLLAFSRDDYDVRCTIGPHHPGHKDAIRLYYRGEDTNPKTLWNPIFGARRQAEWDDHGEVYPWHIDGPDIWYLLKIANKGTFKVSMYFVNPDGHGGNNRMRDYLIEFYPTTMIWEESRSRFDTEKNERVTYLDVTPEIGRNGEKLARKIPPLVRSRVRDFWGGVHVQFVVTGPHNYLVKIDRNYSFNTIMSSVAVDQMYGEPTIWVKKGFGIPKMQCAPYDPPPFPKSYSTKEAKKLYGLWDRLDKLYGFVRGIEYQRKLRIAIYQTTSALAAANPDDQSMNELAYAMKWRLNHWDEKQRKEWQEAMLKGLEKYYKLNQSVKRSVDDGREKDRKGIISDYLKNRKPILYD